MYIHIFAKNSHIVYLRERRIEHSYN